MKLVQLHLRDLFWMVLFICMALGWWAQVRQIKTDLMYQARLVEAMALALSELGCTIATDSAEITRITIPHKYSTGLLELNASVPGEELQRTMRGEFRRELTAAERNR